MLEKAIQIATEAHKGQVDKGGHDYIGHPLRVMNLMETEDEKIVAVLHDVLEDTDMTVADLKQAGFSPEVILGVRAMSRSKDETYNSYISRVVEDKIAIRVKLGDLKDNLDMTRLRSLKDIDINSISMYLKTYHKIISIIGTL